MKSNGRGLNMFLIFQCQMCFTFVMLKCAPASFWISWPAGWLPGYFKIHPWSWIFRRSIFPRKLLTSLIPTSRIFKFAHFLTFPNIQYFKMGSVLLALADFFFVPPRALKERRLLAAHRGLPQVGSKMVALGEADIVKTVQ